MMVSIKCTAILTNRRRQFFLHDCRYSATCIFRIVDTEVDTLSQRLYIFCIHTSARKWRKDLVKQQQLCSLNIDENHKKTKTLNRTVEHITRVTKKTQQRPLTQLELGVVDAKMTVHTSFGAKFPWMNFFKYWTVKFVS